MSLQIIFIIYMYKQDSALNDLQGLMCYKTNQQTNQPTCLLNDLPYLKSFNCVAHFNMLLINIRLHIYIYIYI